MKMNYESFNKNIMIRKCTVDDVDSIYNIQNIVIDNFKEEEKGYFLPFKKETYLRIVNDPINDGEIYGAFTLVVAEAIGAKYIVPTDIAMAYGIIARII